MIEKLVGAKQLLNSILQEMERPIRFVGIDPGVNGCVFLLGEHDVYTYSLMPKQGTQLDLHALNKIFAELSTYDSYVVLEHVHAVFNSSAGATFSFGWACGVLEGMLISHGIRYIKVQPKVWQEFVWQGVRPKKLESGKTNTKAMTMVGIQNLLPNINLVPDRCKKPHDGLADAAGMAVYAKYRVYQK